MASIAPDLDLLDLESTGSNPADPGTVTDLLSCWRQGDLASGQVLFDRLYSELRRLAAGKMRRERLDHTLQPTAMVHELYLRLSTGAAVPARDREHFLAIAARVMGRILTDYARERRAQKRGGGALFVTLDSEVGEVPPENVDIVSLAKALDRLRKIDRRKVDIVTQRFLCGATIAEIALALDLSERTVKREWAFARAWLLRELEGTG